LSYYYDIFIVIGLLTSYFSFAVQPHVLSGLRTTPRGLASGGGLTTVYAGRKTCKFALLFERDTPPLAPNRMLWAGHFIVRYISVKVVKMSTVSLSRLQGY